MGWFWDTAASALLLCCKGKKPSPHQPPSPGGNSRPETRNMSQSWQRVGPLQMWGVQCQELIWLLSVACKSFFHVAVPLRLFCVYVHFFSLQPEHRLTGGNGKMGSDTG